MKHFPSYIFWADVVIGWIQEISCKYNNYPCTMILVALLHIEVKSPIVLSKCSFIYILYIILLYQKTHCFILILISHIISY